MRKGLLPACLLLACCATPPRTDDRSTPVDAYRTFRGALARGEHAREWDCLSDGLRRRLGIRSRAEWEDARLFLDQSHILVRGIVRSKAEGEAVPEPDGRMRVELDFPLGYSGEVWMRRFYVLRVYEPRSERPFVYEQLDTLRATPLEDGVLLEVPPGLMNRYVAKQFKGRVVSRVELREEWFLDDFAAAGQTSASISRKLDERG